MKENMSKIRLRFNTDVGHAIKRLTRSSRYSGSRVDRKGKEGVDLAVWEGTEGEVLGEGRTRPSDGLRPERRRRQ